ncbi:MAG: fused MFS/spermidine synthase [Alphaproteobacteria bacterium]|nr:fused MFS/spermidine synthase [Alphaproteobacteria bacterium]
MITLDTYETEFGHIQIAKRRRTGAVLYEQDGCFQSEADSQGVSLASYIHAIFGLIQQSGARNILLIGCGGGTLATMLVRSGQNATVVDVNPASFVIAKIHFLMPDDVCCRVGDGKEFLRNNGKIFDAIVVDAYQGGLIPDHLQSVQFFNLVRDHLSLRGVLFINAHLGHAFDRRAKQIADRASQVFSKVRLLDSRGILERNAIIMAGHVDHLDPPQILLQPETGQAEIASELASLEFRRWDL